MTATHNRQVSQGPLTKRWSVLNSHFALDKKWFRVRQECVQLPNGQVLDDYFVWEKGDAALVVPMTAEGLLVLTRQYKHGLGDVVIEFPGGAIESGESPEMAARREVTEETGFTVASLTPVAILVNDPTKERGRLHVYVGAESVKTQEPTPEITEDIETIVVSPGMLRQLIDGGGMCTASSVAAAMIVLDDLA